ncbi:MULTISPECIES: hypothetical protein [Halomonadaceae]|mgnify:CR=1 FL=1|uniref:hypothetical protein n=1 Tax=Halomonadaceae TaxID=28256 RepID=UPI0012FEA8CF|nr:hypothetical protein [Halomonas sp. MES3-P3E]
MRNFIILFILGALLSSNVSANPPNSRSLGDSWICNEGYQRVGNSCERLSVPDNARVLGNMWMCNEGYQRVGNSCERLSVPDNARVLGNMWMCNEGYQRVGNSCERFSVPDNARVLGNMWMCNEGYKKVGGRCQRMTAQELEEKKRLLELVAQRQAELRAKGASGQTCETEYDTGAEVCLSVEMANLDCDESYDDSYYDDCEVNVDYSLETDYRGSSEIDVEVYCEAEIDYQSRSGLRRSESDGYHESHSLGSYESDSGYVNLDFSFSSYEEVYKVNLDDAWCEMQSVELN